MHTRIYTYICIHMHLISYTYLIYINVAFGPLIYSLMLLIPHICLGALTLHRYVIFVLAWAPAGGPSLPRNYMRVLPYSMYYYIP